MKQIKRLLIIVATIYLIFVSVLFIFQRKFIYFPTAQDFNDCPNFPNASKVVYEGTRMYVQKTTDVWVVIYHGNAGSACDRSYFLDYFDPKNYSYIIVEYAGYSNDTRSSSQKVLMKNVEAANDYLKKQNPSKIIIVGESLGTALAVYHYSLNHSDKLLLISSFDNARNVAQFHYRFYPAKLMILDNYPSDKWIKDANNVLIIHGSNDSIIPIIFGRALFQKIEGQNKTFMEVSGAGHNDIYDFTETQTAIKAFIK